MLIRFVWQVHDRIRLKIEEDSLRKIRAEMPTTNDKWVVEKVWLT